MSCLENKIILLTGGTGSFGKKFVEIVLKKHNPKTLRVFSRDELKQSIMSQQFHDERLRFFIGDIKDRERLNRAMIGVDIVVHAAALKQVPSCEYNPFEAIKTNILGGQNIIDVSIDNKVEKVMFLSTDKAVNPVSLYGATKLCSEKLFVQGNVYAGLGGAKMSVVRYGNVLGSRGSVIPLFKEQRKKGVITLTDERMTRFWITQGEAVKFIINCIERMRGGEIFVPKIPSMKMLDLAKIIAPGAEIKNIGIRPGEKLKEILLMAEEARHSKEFSDYFVVEPEFAFWRGFQRDDNGERGKPLQDGFEYRSDNNDWWLNKEELRKMLDELDELD